MGRWTWPLIVGLVVLLGVLAALQYRWIGEVSRADRERLRTALRVAAQRFAADFDRELGDIFVAFLPAATPGAGEPGSGVPERYESWRQRASFPGLIQQVLVVPADGGRVRCLDPASASLEPCRPAGEVAALIQRLPAERPVSPLDARVPALVLPLERRAGPPGPARHLAPAAGVLVIPLDMEVVTTQLLPDLVARDLGGLDATAEVLAPERRDPLIWTSAAGPPEPTAGRGDVEVPLLGLGAVPEALARQLRDLDVPSDQPRRPGFGRRQQLLGLARAGGDWRLVVSYRGGSVDAAVGALRRRNLAISAGILVLLGASVVLIVLSARRAQWLARRQLQFVAGVSHELKTPLAAIRSAAENLAEGVVSDPAGVREYGELVDREGRRLGRMVGEILELAGMQGRQPSYRRQPVDLAEVIEVAVADCRWTLDSHRMRAEIEVADGLAPILGDREALRRALVNLVDNAAKHAASGRVVQIRAALGQGGRELLLTVADRGGGIHRRDLPHVFEPFFRGRGPAARAGGSGLGLALVQQIAERHGGRVTVTTGRDGTAITLHLPVEPDRGDDHDG